MRKMPLAVQSEFICYGAIAKVSIVGWTRETDFKRKLGMIP